MAYYWAIPFLFLFSYSVPSAFSLNTQQSCFVPESSLNVLFVWNHCIKPINEIVIPLNRSTHTTNKITLNDYANTIHS